ncbi:hypothetical protein TELCIR_10700, partial [Teladorsagia circumcincta]
LARFEEAEEARRACRVSQAIRQPQLLHHSPILNNDIHEFIVNVPNENLDLSAAYLWTWQTCTEFGFYQSTDYGFSIFGNPLPLNFFVQLCSDLFGKEIMYSAAINQQSVLETNHHYGGKYKYKGTNVIMTQGSLDPWHALGNKSCDPSNNCYLIEGTAHCADMYPARSEDVPALKETRTKMEKIIEKWLTPSAPNDIHTERRTSSPNNIETSSSTAQTKLATDNPLNNDISSEKKATKQNTAGAMAFSVLISFLTSVMIFFQPTISQ